MPNTCAGQALGKSSGNRICEEVPAQTICRGPVPKAVGDTLIGPGPFGFAPFLVRALVPLVFGLRLIVAWPCCFDPLGRQSSSTLWAEDLPPCLRCFVFALAVCFHLHVTCTEACAAGILGLIAGSRHDQPEPRRWQPLGHRPCCAPPSQAGGQRYSFAANRGAFGRERLCIVSLCRLPQTIELHGQVPLLDGLRELELQRQWTVGKDVGILPILPCNNGPDALTNCCPTV